MDISKRVFGSNVPKEVQDYINNLQQGSFEVNPGDSVNDNPISYLGDKSPYVRMWTAVSQTKVKWATDKDGKKKWLPEGDRKNFVYSINENRSKSYDELESMDLGDFKLKYEYKGELENNPLLKPSAGIKSVNSKSEGSLGALRRTTVEFVVHNKNDFETIYLPFFLKPGATVFIDFGWSDKSFKLYNPEGKLHFQDDVSMKKFWNDIIQSKQNTVQDGLTTTIGGQVVKYDVSVDQNGSFNCTLECVSSNYRLLDRSVTDDNDLKFVFNNTIEELILGYYAKLTGNNVVATDLAYTQNSVLSDEDRRDLVRQAFDDARDVQGNANRITSDGKISGIFYQDQEAGDEKTDKEALYISYGLFEDKFLNTFISEWAEIDDDGEIIENTKQKSEDPFSPSFTSINSYIRYDEDLFKMQELKYRKQDKLLSFLYPNEWGFSDDDYQKPNTYNGKRKPLGLYNEKTNPNGWKSTTEDKTKRRIPLRELFIAVPVISEAFKKSTNVNDALEFIFNEIYEDSGNIINIKMITPNDTQTAITFTDINVEMDRFNSANDDTLRFDLTSGNTIVQSFDMKFETPKAGLSSMIAIGNQSRPQVFDELELMKFNLLNAVQSDAKYQVQHLPIFPETKRKATLTIKLDELLKEDTNNKPNMQKFDYEGYKRARKSKIKKDSDSNQSQEVDNTEQQMPDVDEATGNPILYGNSERDLQLLAAKLNNFIKTNENGISPVMPITLSLKVYGNNFLSYGDFFTVNYLPRHYQERVIFQIVGVDHTVDSSGWSTNYTTVMRLKSTEKYRQFGDKRTDEPVVFLKYHKKFMEFKVDEVMNSSGEDNENHALGTIVDDIDQGEKVQVGASDKAVKVLDPNSAEFPNLQINEEIWTIDPVNKEEDLKKLKEKHSGWFSSGGDKVMSDRISMPVTIEENILNPSHIAYWAAISSLILGDELINWKKVKEIYKSVAEDKKLQRKVRLIDWDRGKEGSVVSKSGVNAIYVLPVNDEGELNKHFEKYVLDDYDDLLKVKFKLFDRVAADEKFDLDPLQKALAVQLGAFEYTKMRGIGVFGDAVSSELSYDNNTDNTSFLRKNNFHFFNLLSWHIPKETKSKWSVISITGDGDNGASSVLSKIIIPFEAKQNQKNKTFKKIFDEWYKKYVTAQAVWKSALDTKNYK